MMHTERRYPVEDGATCLACGKPLVRLTQAVWRCPDFVVEMSDEDLRRVWEGSAWVGPRPSLEEFKRGRQK